MSLCLTAIYALVVMLCVPELITLPVTEITSCSYALLQIFGRGACHCTTWTGLKKVQSSSGWMLRRTRTTLRSPYGVCEAQLFGVEEARRRFLEVGLDSRPVMREVYVLFKDGGDPEKLVSDFSSGSGGEVFYSSLYAELYYESQHNQAEQNDAEMAKSHIVAACKSPYGSRSGDYMASLAFVHCQCRNWNLE